MFNNLKLGTKLSIGFGFLVIMLLGVGLTGFLSLEGASTGFTGYRELARDTVLSSRVQANMLMVRMNAKDYIITTKDKDKKQFEEYLEKTKGFLETAQVEIQNPERAKLIDSVDEKLKEYDRAFNEVVGYQNQRMAYVKTMNKIGPQAESGLTDILVSARRDGDMEAAYWAAESLRSLMLGRLYVMKYLDDNSQSSMDRMISEMDNLKDNLAEMDRQLQNSQRRQLMNEVDEIQSRYLIAARGVNEAIKSRNALVTGVLDRIGPDIAKAIEDVKLSVKDEQDTLGPQLQAANTSAVNLIMILSSIAVLFGVTLAVTITKAIMRQLGGEPAVVVDVAKRVAEGDLNLDLNDNVDSRSLYASVREMVKKLKEKAVVAEAIAKGDLTVNVELASGKDQLGTALKDMTRVLNEVIGQVRASSKQVASGSQAMSSSSEELSQGATEQASSAEEASSSVEEMIANIRQNTENAKETERIAVAGAQNAQESGEAVNQMVTAMQEIAGKILIVEEIARQTNLLALNAAIEAARAGEHGKGFAVVAAEVRKLAERSQEAAAEINGLSVSSVDVAETAGKALDVLVPNIKKTAELVQEIAAASREQDAGAEQIGGAIMQLDSVIQQNASSSEEMASTAEELSSQSEALEDIISFFKVDLKQSVAPRIEQGASNVSSLARSVPYPQQKSIPEDNKAQTRKVDMYLKNGTDTLDSEFEEF